MSAKGGCLRPKKSLETFPTFGLEAGSFCILSHKEKFRWNQTKTRYRGGRHVPGHIWYPGGVERTAAENLFPFVRFTSEFMGF